MKNYPILFFFLVIAHFSSNAQQYAGNWEGKLNIKGRKLALVFHINSLSDSKYGATMDIPEQKVFNLAATAVAATEQKIEIRFSALGININGSLNGPKKLNCVFEQGSASFPFELKNTGEVTAGKIYKRQQTPAPPYPYNSEDVEYDNADGSLHFGGTLTYPGNTASAIEKFPAILLITGSGAQDRDETIFDHKPFAILSDLLTKAGYAVLRVDDRSMGKTTGNYRTSTTGDFAADAETSLSYLKMRKEVDTSRLGLLGHSEGGLIASMVASKRKDVKFLILMAAPVANPIDLATEQSADILISQGIPESRIKEFRPLMRDMITAIVSTSDNITALKDASDVFVKWEATQSQKTTRITTGVKDEKSMQTFIGRLIAQLNTPWYQYFMRLRPADYYKALSCRVLGLYGEKDFQVDPEVNSELLKLYTSTDKTEIKILPGLNHLFQTCKKCTFAEYADLEQTLSPEFLELVEEWVRKK
jgi:pimeloyl-ACP methyl ester carboxylesterase